MAILMLNKWANPVAAAVRAKTRWVLGLSGGLVGLGLGLFGVLSARMLRPLRTLTAVAGEVAQGHLAVAVPPPRSADEVGRLTATFDTMLAGLRQRDMLRQTFGRYLSEEVAAALLASPEALHMGGELLEVTCLVSDVRGFTALAAQLAPHQVIAVLNRYLECMVEVIQQYHGTISDFQGDGIQVLFGAPLAAADDPERALACAIAMQCALRSSIPRSASSSRHSRWALGSTIGEVIVGNIGSVKRAKYGAIGTALNMAYRIESYTVGGQILISPSLYAQVQALVQVRGHPRGGVQGPPPAPDAL